MAETSNHPSSSSRSGPPSVSSCNTQAFAYSSASNKRRRSPSMPHEPHSDQMAKRPRADVEPFEFTDGETTAEEKESQRMVVNVQDQYRDLMAHQHGHMSSDKPPLHQASTVSLDHMGKMIKILSENTAWLFEKLRSTKKRYSREILDLKKQHKEVIMKERQDRMLDKIQLQKDFGKREYQLQRRSSMLQKGLDEQIEHTNREREAAKAYQLCADDMRKKWENCLLDKQDAEAHVESLQFTISTLDSDLSQLRSMHIEEKAERRRREGLPPAYGSLDDEQPPWIHEDAGSFSLASYKQLARSTLDRHLTDARVKYDRRLASRTCSASATLDFYTDVFEVWNEVAGFARTLHNSMSGVAGVAGEKGSSSKLCKVEALKGSSARAYVAPRIAQLIISFTWQMIASMDLLPTAVKMKPGSWFYSRLKQQQEGVDDTLRQVLSDTFFHMPKGANAQGLLDAQRYVTEIIALQKRLARMFENTRPYSCLSKSYEAVSEQIDVLRKEWARERDMGVVQRAQSPGEVARLHPAMARQYNTTADIRAAMLAPQRAEPAIWYE